MAWDEGSTIHPGRYLAKKALFTCGTLLLSGFNVCSDIRQSFPHADFPTLLGIACIAQKDSAIVTLRLC